MMFARWLLALMLAAMASTVWADVYLKDELIDFNRDAAAGGKGTLYGQFAFRRDAAKRGSDQGDWLDDVATGCFNRFSSA